MNGMFDFNGNGSTDLGEQFIAYNIYKDVTKSSSAHGSYPAKTWRTGLEPWEIFMIIFIIIYELLNG